MENGAHKLLESATQRTLHAHAFSRSSSQASSVLTDLLSRYLTLLTSTCAKYAQHSGRTTMNVRDALGALEELGVSLDELSEYGATEGKELNRYALYSARRVEDLHEFRSQLVEGLRQDRDDAIPLVYARCPTPLLEELDSEDDEEVSDEDPDPSLRLQYPPDNPMDIDEAAPLQLNTFPRKRPPSRPTTPPLPLSPISNPSSPKRKRPRRFDWEPPSHIPDFLPPFPSVADDAPLSPIDAVPTPSAQPMMPPPPTSSTTPDAVPDKQPAMTLAQSLTSAAASDILVQVPYTQSSLASVSDRHLPSALPPLAPSQPHRQNRLPTPQIEPSLLAAFHHILTHPPPAELPPLNPSRHKVAMALIKQAQGNPRWDPADTLYASVAPCAPRVATIGPSYPVAIGETPNEKGRDGKDKDFKLPPALPRPVSAIERIAPFVSQQTSRIPDLARHVLPPAIHARTSRLSHPPVLHRGAKALTYGPGIAAPWNANPLSSSSGAGADGVPATPLTKDNAPSTSSRDTEKPLLPDARLYATWDYETKDFKAPLAPLTRGRARMGSVQMQASGSGIISLPNLSRSKGIK